MARPKGDVETIPLHTRLAPLQLAGFREYLRRQQAQIQHTGAQLTDAAVLRGMVLRCLDLEGIPHKPPQQELTFAPLVPAAAPPPADPLPAPAMPPPAAPPAPSTPPADPPPAAAVAPAAAPKEERAPAAKRPATKPSAKTARSTKAARGTKGGAKVKKKKGAR